jgi:hypothetical protein
MNRSCRLCDATDPSLFYETQAHRLCRSCFRQTYYQAGRERLIQSKLDRGECMDCHLQVTLHTTPVFDYDHREAKHRELSKLCYAPLATFEAELAKCDLVCANCHRLRTQARGYSRGGGRPRAVPCRAPSTLNPAPFSLGSF